MGQLWSRENKSSPSESPLDESLPVTAQVERKLPFDPRSVSDDVSRTPIQIKDDDEDEATPGSGTKLLLSDSGVDEVKVAVDTPSSAEILLQHKLKSLSLDPRSPSGIPRTPIVVEEENSVKTEEQPKRGAVAAKMPATKLEFEENTELDKAAPVQDEEVQILTEKNVSEYDGEEEKIVPRPEDEVIVIQDDDASDDTRDVEEESKKDDEMDDTPETEALNEKTLESTLEEGEIRSSSEDEEENEEPELNLRPQKPLMSPVKTALPREAGSALTPSRVPLGDVDNKDNSLVI